MTFRKIVAATDFSPGSERALSIATRLAVSAAAELVVVHVLEVPTAFGGELPAPTDIVVELKEEAGRGLDQAVAEARTRGAVRVSSQLLEGTAPESLLRLVDAPDVDLIVVGTHGRTGLARVLLGSIAENIVRHAACSVLVVRPGDELVRFSHVLCPVDGEEASRSALWRAVQLAKADDARLTLLNVVELGVGYSGRRAVQYLQHLERSSRELLDKEKESLNLITPLPTIDTRTVMGSAGGQILAALEDDRSIDLVVMGSRGRTGIKRVFLGSVAEKVVRHAPCPVLIARKRA
jgi:nucleotide-binding universal stress UspA family protein